MNTSLYEVSREHTAPVLLDYVQWVLKEAQARNITTLYFLARDGFVLREIAERVCMKDRIPIHCRYLYCSRASLRMPSYHLIGDEAYELLFLYGFHITVKTFFDRAGISEEQQKTILLEMGYDRSDLPDRELTRDESVYFTKSLRTNQTFNAILMKNSKEAYAPTIRYLEQEDVFKQDTFAIVDSGWMGSMQRSLRQLLHSKDFSGKIVGFYFGMFAEPKSAEDGEYLAWYFTKRRGLLKKATFCNNVFECMLSAPHGMTTGYHIQDGIVVPTKLDGPKERQKAQIKLQIQGILDGMDGLNHVRAFDEQRARKNTYVELKKIMFCPPKEAVQVFGQFLFCDDTTEKNLLPLASSAELAKLHEYNILSRIWRRLSRRKQHGAVQQANLFWPYGTAALLPGKVQRWWYRSNILLWEILKYIRNW